MHPKEMEITFFTFFSKLIAPVLNYARHVVPRLEFLDCFINFTRAHHIGFPPPLIWIIVFGL